MLFRSVAAVRPKVEDYFARCRLAAFDARALGALNRSEGEYLAIAAKDLKVTTEEVAGFPLARIEAGRALPLADGVNPAWAVALATLRTAAVAPLLGDRAELTAADWAVLTARLAPYDAWRAGQAGSAVASLGLARLRAVQQGPARAELEALLRQDQAARFIYVQF